MKYKNKSIQISCDGGAATGKSTGAQMIAKKYKLKFLSSGLLYRYASFLILKYKPKNKLSILKNYFKKLDYKQLKKINLQLWDIEDGKRLAEKNNKFDKDFIQLARNVYKINDERAKIKLKINLELGSNIKEVKSYE